MLALLFLSLSTCGRDNPMRSSGAADVVVAPAKAVLNGTGQTVRLTATVRDQAGQTLTSADVRWSSGSPSVATVDQSGLVTARQAGTAVITAASGNASGQATVTVEPLKPKTLAVTPATATLTAPGQTVRLTATARDQAGQSVTGADVRWSSGSPSVATVGQSGLVTARQFGTAIITATSGGTTGQATVTVDNPVQRTVAVSPAFAPLAGSGHTVRLSATVRDLAGQPLAAADVQWSSGSPSVAAVDQSGMVTARQPGTAVIMAAFGDAAGHATVRVGDSAQRTLSITPRTTKLTFWRETIQLSATVYDGKGEPVEAASVSWSSGNARVATVDGNGLVTGGQPGMTWITAVTDGATGQAEVTVAQTLRVDRITIWENSPRRMTPGESHRIDPEVLGEDGKKFESPALAILWSSDNPAVATVDESGQVTAHADGTARITATAGYGAAKVKATLTIYVHHPDRDILIALFHATDGPNWINATGWNGDSPLRTWHGVLVDDTGRVSGLNLAGNRLKGRMPLGLAELEHLRVLTVGSNELVGRIPQELGGLSGLAELDLSRNQLSGPVPVALGDLAGLEQLRLDHNALAGPLPQSLTSLVGLQVLHADGSDLCAPRNAVFQAWLRKIGDRRVADCENRDREALAALYRATDGPNWTNRAGWLTDALLNEWHGVSVGESEGVTRLDLSHNNLTGEVPTALGELSGLTALNLSSNALSGSVPVSLSRLGLEFLLLDGTDLCLPLSAEFQAWLRGIPDPRAPACEDRETLVALYRATGGPNWTNHTGWLTDAPLSEWHGVTVDQERRVTGLNLRANRLSGPVPAAELSRLDRLRHVDFQFNLLNGSIPAAIGYHNNLQGLNLSANRLSGPIPSELGFLDQLKSLDLGSNELSGPIPPELGRLNQLQSLSLIQNRLTGSLPPELGRLPNLTYLRLYDNELSGPIPPELGLLNRLKSLELGKNGLSGSIPTELSDLEQLRHLELHDNPLSGYVPLTLVRLRYLSTLYLNGTQTCIPLDAHFNAWLQRLLNKRLPGFCEDESLDQDREILAAFHAATNGPGWTNAAGWLSESPLNEWHGVTTDENGRVTELALTGNGLSGPIPAELFLLARLASLNLGNNELSGPVPPEMGGLEALRVLNLGNNELSGPVPPEMGGLEELRHLDLSGNGLSGPVPIEWTRLSRLETLRLDSAGVCVLPYGEYRSWVLDIVDSRVDNCEDPDREVLFAFYHAMNGPQWKNAGGWLSEAPLGEWQGVVTDENGRVTALEVEDDLLMGYIPPELGRLDMLRRLSLRGDFRYGAAPPRNGLPSELGDLANLEELRLSLIDFQGATIPPEMGKLQKLKILDIYHSSLRGPIPPELGNLSILRKLSIAHNPSISGSIPATLGNLEKLEILVLALCSLSGHIPSELGRLVNLEEIRFYLNSLAGPIPPELGGLTNLEVLDLSNNQLTGPIPPELGRLASLDILELDTNRLTGPIPIELGNTRLSTLQLNGNNLTGSIPAELGDAPFLYTINLSKNSLTGPVPPELGKLNRLTELLLFDNGALSGPLPLELMRLQRLKQLGISGTNLCGPPDVRFWSWVQSIPARVVRCGPAALARAYLTQAVQSLDHPVPLVAGERALLRVFIAAGEQAGTVMPPVRATFYHDGIPAHVVVVPGSATAMPAEIDEGSLSASINAEVPAWVIQPGLQMVIKVDPDGASDPAEGSVRRLPEVGRTNVEVVDAPLRLTVVPFLWTDDSDRSVLDATAGLTAGDDLFRYTRDLLPVGEFSLNVRDYVWTSTEPSHENWVAVLRETMLLRTSDGSEDHYMGVLRNGGKGGSDKVFLSRLDNLTIAHELGHNMGLRHAPCGTLGVDPYYPYLDGSIGAWGFDFKTGALVPPETWDLMSYCSPNIWISDYHFTKAIKNRQTELKSDGAGSASVRALLLWGGVDENGALVLEPAFVADDATWTPPERGPYRLTGTDNRERVLFSLDFGMDEFAHLEGGAFAFALPARSSWAGRLARITLTGPEGLASMGAASERSAALLRDRITGQVRGLLRDMPGASATTDGIAARVLPPEPGLEIVISHGVPEAASW